jgi:hypothetical protein
METIGHPFELIRLDVGHRYDPRFRQLPQRGQMSVGRHPSTPDQT